MENFVHLKDFHELYHQPDAWQMCWFRSIYEFDFQLVITDWKNASSSVRGTELVLHFGALVHANFCADGQVIWA